MSALHCLFTHDSKEKVWLKYKKHALIFGNIAAFAFSTCLLRNSIKCEIVLLLGRGRTGREEQRKNKAILKFIER